MIDITNFDDLEVIESITLDTNGGVFSHKFELGYDYFIGQEEASDFVIKCKENTAWLWTHTERGI